MKLSLEGILYSSICLVLFGSGLILLVGYFKHSRAFLDEEKIIPLWVGTFLFNLILFVSGVYFSYPAFTDQAINSDNLFGNPSLSFFSVLVGWWLIAIILSASATVSELKANQR